MQSRWAQSGRRLRRAWMAVVGSLAVVVLGIFGDYAIPDTINGGVGFLVTNVGFLGVMVALPILGWALHFEHKVRSVAAWEKQPTARHVAGSSKDPFSVCLARSTRSGASVRPTLRSNAGCLGGGDAV